MNASQKRAVETYRRRLRENGLARYEVRGSASDKALIRSLAKRLAENDTAAYRLRQELAHEISGRTCLRPRTGKDIWDALRRSPLVGADLDLTRDIVPERHVAL
ncbi:MAG: hypothetical protein AB7H90_06075 [Alphaproteobacteria bacterium]